MSSSDGGQPCHSDTDSSVEESDFDTMPDIESDKTSSGPRYQGSLAVVVEMEEGLVVK